MSDSDNKSFGQKHKSTLRAAMLTVVIVGSVLITRAAGLFVPLELMAYDLAVRTLVDANADERIVLVNRSEEDLRALGYPTSDNLLTDVLEKIAAGKPSAIGVDIYRDQPMGAGGERLDALLARQENLLWIMKYTDRDGHRVPPPPPLKDKPERVGFSDLLDDPGGIIRRGILMLDDGKTSANSFALQLVLHYLKARGIGLSADPANAEVLRLGATSIPPFEKDDGGYVRADAAGYQFLLDFKGMRAHFPNYSFQEVLGRAGNAPSAAAFAGKIVIVGSSAKSLNDLFYTPLSATLDEQRMVGSELHGAIVSQLLRHAEGVSRPLAPLNDWLEIAWITAMGILGVAIGLNTRRIALFILFLAGAAAAIAGVSFGLFTLAVWLPIVAPLAACIACLTAASAYAAQQQREQRGQVMRFFAQHVSKDIAEEIWRRRDDFIENNRPRPIPLTATVLFTDLEGFTEVSEKLAPDELFDWLNEYMHAMSAVVLRHKGVINKYIGDAVMGIFGVPIKRVTEAEVAADARNAVACALEMEQTLIKLNAKWKAEGKTNVRMRVGIYTGPLVAGLLGGADRMEYTVIGDTVNTASRLESAGKNVTLPQAKTRCCCITIGGPTRELLGESMPGVIFTPIGEMSLKGKELKILTFYVETPTTGGQP